MKQCTKCLKRKELSEFPDRWKGSQDGKSSHCKQCKRDYARETQGSNINILNDKRMRETVRKQLAEMLIEAYETGAEDGYSNTADKSSRDELVNKLLEQLK